MLPEARTYPFRGMFDFSETNDDLSGEVGVGLEGNESVIIVSVGWVPSVVGPAFVFGPISLESKNMRQGGPHS